MRTIAVIGSGVVGQATGKGFAHKGHKVMYFDINQELISKLQKEGLHAYTVDAMADHPADTYMFTISTPTIDGKIHLDYLKRAAVHFAENVLRHKKDHCLIVVRSTVPPGTTEHTICSLIEKHSGKKAGRDFSVCMNPEFLREHRNEEDFAHPWIIVIGSMDAKSYESMEELYRPYDCPCIRMTLAEAEMEKYIHNIWNGCKISFFNEMRMVCDKAGIDADKVFKTVVKSAESSWNAEYGTKNMGPYGGTCLPKDTEAFLYWTKHHLGITMPLLAAEIAVNERVKTRWARMKHKMKNFFLGNFRTKPTVHAPLH